MTSLGLTPSQTVGPFFAIGLPWPAGPYAVPEGTPGAIWIRGQITDGAGEPVPDALVETWQVSPGQVSPGQVSPGQVSPGQVSPGHRGFARAPANEKGEYALLTVKPASTPAPGGGTQAPHLAVSVFARGLLDRVVTRVYFADETAANEVDPILSQVPPERRGTLLAQPDGDGYRFDIRLQGEGETVFFAI